MKTAEELLRDEIRSLRDIALRLCQWGVTVLVGLQTAIFFLRRDLYERLIANGELTKDQALPWNRYLIGTFLLAVVALIFTWMTLLVGKRYRHYRDQLVKHATSGIEEPEISKIGRWCVLSLYFLFPLIDILIRLYVRIEIGLK